MDRTLGDQRLFKKTLAAVFVGAALVVLCYYFVDRRVAFFVHDHGFAAYPELNWLTLPPPVLQAWTPVVLVLILARRATGPLPRWQVSVAAACVAMILADQFRESLSYVFGRDWPETWIDNNPSLIRDGAYGFHPFHGSSAYGSFPSGHTARTLAVAAVVWIAYPRWRWACFLGSATVAVGLIGMNYHFVGDVIAGGFVGGIVGTYTFARFDKPRPQG